MVVMMTAMTLMMRVAARMLVTDSDYISGADNYDVGNDGGDDRADSCCDYNLEQLGEEKLYFILHFHVLVPQ